MPEPLHPGDPTAIGHYRLLSRLGMGGQGVVYLGNAPDGSAVAIKVLHDEVSPRVRERFAKELAAARRVDPFCVAQVLDASLDGRRPYIVSEFVQGQPLQQAGLHRGPALQRVAISTATALAAVHRSGIVHRDFKPANVLLAPDGPRVIDFGIARDTETSLTVTSSIIGTPAYMAPEQLGGREIGPAADVFAWGGVMVFAATGKPPFGNDHLPAVVGRILHAPPNLTGLVEPMRSIVGNCLAKDPAQRPTMHDVLLQLVGEQPVRPLSAAVTTGPVTQPSPRRPQTGLLVAGAAVIVAVSVTVTVVVTTQLTPGRTETSGASSPAPKGSDPKNPDPKASDQGTSDPKASDPRSSDPRPSDSAPSSSEATEDPANKAVVIRSLRAAGSRSGECYNKGVLPRATFQVVDDAEPAVYRWVLDGKESGVSTQYSPKGTYPVSARTSFSTSGTHTAVFKLLRPGTPRERGITVKVC